MEKNIFTGFGFKDDADADVPLFMQEEDEETCEVSCVTTESFRVALERNGIDLQDFFKKVKDTESMLAAKKKAIAASTTGSHKEISISEQ